MSSELLDKLWQRYAAHVPYARDFERLAGDALQNDHVAFRSLDLQPIARSFEQLGWRSAGAYDFPDTHLNAIHLSRADSPRIFVSELRVAELSPRAQELLARLPACALGEGPPPLLTAEELLFLERESQYAAWVLLFGAEVNHFTASVPDIEVWQARMLAAGIPMKADIEGAPGAPLRQTATKAALRRVKLHDQERDWPYAYLEIAQRSPGFDGFVTGQARQLFDMTRR